MAVRKPKNRTGRIVATVAPLASTTTEFFYSSNNRESHGLMASKFGGRTLICFYCNKKSGIKYDGLITQWQCGQCESENYLDENGDITDPPVATDVAAPTDLKYAIPRPESPSAEPSSQSSAIFCSTCIKNQHLYTACLAQYHIETDPSHPEYRELERKYYKYRRNLEKQYPQVCEDCEPKVLDRMRAAGKTAKTDYLRRLLQQSRARRATARSTKITFSGSLEFVGKFLWYFGLAAQLLWHFTALIVTAQHRYTMIFDNYMPPTLLMMVRLATESSDVLLSWSFQCTLSSIWWNPKFKHFNNGFMNHIRGFGEWYKYQAILLLVRGLYYYMIRTTALRDPLSPATLGAHLFGFAFVTYLAIAANYSLKVDMARLWDSTPEKLPHVGPGTSPTTSPPGDSMVDALDQILATPSRGGRSISPPSLVPYDNSRRDGADIRYGDLVPLNQSSEKTHPRHAQLQIKTPPMALKNLSLGDYTARLNKTVAHGGEDQDMMDWSPVQAQSKHRAFNSVRPVEDGTQLFGQAPVKSQSSPFWFKVPPAPITPAQQLRNPPNQPRLRVSSQEVKENFFNNVTRRSQDSEISVGVQPNSGDGGSRQGVGFAQQKFFPPPPPSETGEKLAELLTSFSLSSEVEAPQNTTGSHRLRHFCQAVILFGGLLLWNQVLYNPSEQTKNVTLAIMGACALIGTRTILDNILSKPGGFSQATGALLGILEIAGAVYGFEEILAGRGDYKNCASLGSIFICAIVVYELLHV